MMQQFFIQQHGRGKKSDSIPEPPSLLIINCGDAENQSNVIYNAGDAENSSTTIIYCGDAKNF